MSFSTPAQLLVCRHFPFPPLCLPSPYSSPPPTPFPLSSLPHPFLTITIHPPPPPAHLPPLPPRPIPSHFPLLVAPPLRPPHSPPPLRAPDYPLACISYVDPFPPSDCFTSRPLKRRILAGSAREPHQSVIPPVVRFLCFFLCLVPSFCSFSPLLFPDLFLNKPLC